MAIFLTQLLSGFLPPRQFTSENESHFRWDWSFSAWAVRSESTWLRSARSPPLTGDSSLRQPQSTNRM